MSAISHHNKSTIVRIISRLSDVPWLGDLWLSELFLKAPPRLVASAAELEVLASATAGFIHTRQGRLRSFRWGQGPTILLVHGHGGSSAQLTPFVQPLLARGFSVIAYDAPAHGGSQGRYATLVSMGAALGEVLRQVGPVHGLITHSLGGAAACLAAKAGARIPRSVLIAPPSDVQHWYERFVSDLALSPDQAGRVRGVIERRLATEMGELRAELLGPHVHAETLVIHDRHDKEVSLERGTHVARSIPGARLVTTEGLGHRRILKDERVIEMAVTFATQAPLLRGTLAQLIDDELFHRETRAVA